MAWKPLLHLSMIACLAITGTAPAMAQQNYPDWGQPAPSMRPMQPMQQWGQPMQPLAPSYPAGRVELCNTIIDYQARMRCFNGEPQRRDDNGAAVAAGVVGLALGAIIIGAAASAANKGQQAASEYDRWVAYCRGKYRSFDAATGTFLRSDGRRQQCQ